MRRLVNAVGDAVVGHLRLTPWAALAVAVLASTYCAGNAHAKDAEWKKAVRDKNRQIAQLTVIANAKRTVYVHDTVTVRRTIQADSAAWQRVPVHPVTPQDTASALNALPGLAASDSALRASCGALIASSAAALRAVDTLVVVHVEKEQILTAKPGPSRVRWLVGGMLAGALVAAKVLR